MLGGVSLNRIVLIGLAVTALALTGCGRKGMLDAPPSASARAPQPAPTTDQSSLGEPEHSGLEGERTAELPAASRPAQRSFPLDFLLK